MKKLLFLILLIPISVKAYSSSATSTVLMDMDSLNVIYSNNMNDVRSVASISKIMTAIVAIENKDVKYDIELAETICSLPKGKKEFIKNILPALVDFEPDDKNNEDINKEK